jgi:two-component system OmpR family response regulator
VRILLVEDDPLLGNAVRDHVARGVHAIDWVQSAGDADAALAAVDYGLLLLDLNLPDGHGLDILKTLRRRGSALPVVILTAQNEVTDRIAGLNAGADDYLVKPFDLGELTARISAVARRYVGQPSTAVKCGDLEIDVTNKVLKREGKSIDLTAREWAVIEMLVAHPGITVSKTQIEEALYQFGAEVESNAVEVYVSRLRKKLGDGAIKTARGLGYKLDTGK